MTPRRRAPTPTPLVQVKALADPLRYRVFEGLLEEARTAKQMAEQLGTPPTRLYHHFRVLERAGLIHATGTRQTRGTTEKYFKASLDRVDASGSAATRDSAVAAALLEGVLASTLDDVRQLGTRRRAAGAASTRYLKRYRIRVTPAQVAAIVAQLQSASALCEAAGDAPDAREFGVTLALYLLPDRRRRETRR